jgi:hypothetical protein
VRVEGEIGCDSHNSPVDQAEITSFLLNVVVAYDVPLSPKWDFCFGAGTGAGTGIRNINADGAGVFVDQTHRLSGIRALSALPIRSGGLSISLSIGATAVYCSTLISTPIFRIPALK